MLEDLFRISTEGAIGTINALRLGRLAGVTVDWAEINAAVGQWVLLLHTVAHMHSLKFSTHILVPMGSFSKVRPSPTVTVTTFYHHLPTLTYSTDSEPPLHRYTVTPLHRYTVTPLYRYTVIPLHRYLDRPRIGACHSLPPVALLHRYIVTPLHRYILACHSLPAAPYPAGLSGR